jgi:cellobiose phosphorylase
MTESTELSALRLTSQSGMSLELNSNGSLRQIECGGVVLCLFPGNEVEGGVANVYLRRHGPRPEWIPLLGPASPTRFRPAPVDGRLVGSGTWKGVHYTLTLSLTPDVCAWRIDVHLCNRGPTREKLDLTYVQDIALASYGAVRLNEFYVSQYVDHTPLAHPSHGSMVASRQNQAVDGRYPWSLLGSFRKGVSFATDAMQFHGLAVRAGQAPEGMTSDLPGTRLQHEHSVVVIRDTFLELEAGAEEYAGFFGIHVPDHPEATSSADLDRVGVLLAGRRVLSSMPEAPAGDSVDPATLFSHPQLFASLELDGDAVRDHFGSELRHEERDEDGRLLSFFHGADRHVVLRRKELKVRRPHGHILRSGTHLTPDESALTSTAWMAGVFHSMVTQGHVGINRFLSTVRSYLSLYRSHGQRVFVELDGAWHLLDVPSAFEMSPNACRWLYRHAAGEIQVVARAEASPHQLTLDVQVTAGPPTRFLVTHHIALNGDDGSSGGPALWSREGRQIRAWPAPGSELAERFPHGGFLLEARPDTELEHVGGDESLFLDGRSRGQPFLCVVTAKARSAGLTLRGDLVSEATQSPVRATGVEALVPKLRMRAAGGSGASDGVARLAEIVHWFAHDAFVHYLSPRGLEQFSGGGWGTRDVCQGPVELLLALGRPAPIRDLLLRVLRQQNSDGDWPQWFMFFERERSIRPGDSHGDIVFWPLLALAQYLDASRDAALLDEPIRFFDARGSEHGELATVWQHVERALALIRKRIIPGTLLAAYGHGDWNDSLQPADPRLRERLCSAWTVILNYQTLVALGDALIAVGRGEEGRALRSEAGAIHAEFQRHLIVDGVLTGYALFEEGGSTRYVLHPRDELTGVHYSALGMIHAVLEDLLSPEQVRAHLQLLGEKLSGPDGLRLFDRPFPYHGGPQKLFQRAESATFFGREIGLMYTHAHLRYAQALAHVGDAEGLFRALCQVNPIGIRDVIPSATPRQANCYYSSSDAAFADRYEASEHYSRVGEGKVPLDGGWRVYSSGAGIALGLIVRKFLGLDVQADLVSFDPVLPPALNELTVETALLDHEVEVRYRIAHPGSGVAAVQLNGQPLPITFQPNPHRRGAAVVSKESFVQALRPKGNVLELEVGSRGHSKER